MYNYEIIEKNLTTNYIGKTFIQFDSLSSTHQKAKNISSNCPAGMLVLSEVQDDVKLKNGKMWININGDNLCMSIILKNAIDKDYSSQLLQIANSAICKTILELDSNIRCYIKWPNDIYINDKKLASVLAEAINKKDNKSIILSIFLNIHIEKEEASQQAQNSDNELSNYAIALTEVYSGELIREIFISNIINKIEIYYDELIKSKKMNTALSVFRENNCILGKKIGIKKVNKKTVKEVTATNINDEGQIEYIDKDNTKGSLVNTLDVIEWWQDDKKA